MTGIQVVDAIVDILVEGLVKLGTGIGSGVANAVQALAFTTVGEGANATTELSVFFIMVCVFGAIALAVGLTTRIFTWLESLGN